jgi:glycogen(starch) synthase
MRILHLSSLYPPYLVGGAERVVEILAEGMAAEGLSVGVAHLVPERQPRTRRNGVDIFPLAHRNPLWVEASAQHLTPVRNLNKVVTLFNVMTTRDFAVLLDQYVPDIVHSHSMVELTPWMWRVAKDRGIKIVHTLQDFDLLCIRAALFKNGQRCQRRHVSCVVFSEVKKHYHRTIDQVVGASQSILHVHHEMGFFNELREVNQHVIWNPVRLSRERARAPRIGCTGPLVFGFLGRLAPEKGINILLAACRSLSMGGWMLKIAGRAPVNDAALRAQTAGLPIDFLGFVDPLAFFDNIDVLVAPAIWSEPFGLTVVEAFSAGIPVIGSDLGGVAETIRQIEPEWLVPPGDPGALAAKMSAFIHAGRKGLQKLPDFSALLSKVDSDFVIRRYIDVYHACFSA